MRASMIVLVIASFLPTCCCNAAELFVSPDGRDTNPGTSGKPFASLDRARDVIRQMKSGPGLPEGGVTVWIGGGTYVRTSSFELTPQDSGAADRPIVYRAEEGRTVRVRGGREIRGWKPARDPDGLRRLDASAMRNVVQCDLRAQGISDYGKLSARGFGRACIPSHMQLFLDDKPMELAGWPNNGWDMIAAVPAGQNGGKYTYAGDRPERWAKEDDIWVHGYWTWPWAESHEKVEKIDTATKEIYTRAPHGSYGYQAHKRWRAINLLEELDMPGEYYIDRKSGILYFWPPTDLRRSHAVVSELEGPLVSMKDCSNISLVGLTFEDTRGDGIFVDGTAENILIAGCVVRNIGNNAINVRGGSRVGIQSCDIYNTGDYGVLLGGGDRKTLTAAGNYVDNCRIHDVAGWVRTYRSHIQLTGVGNRASHNLLYSSPHTAIFFHGNNHVIEFNEIHDVCAETGDAGAVYTGRDWTYQGNVIRYNYIHDVGNFDDKYSGHSFSETMGIYLDDFTSGTRAYGNVIRNVQRAMLIGGGRSNTLQNNIIIDCRIGLHFDARGTNWAANYFDGRFPWMFDRMKDVNATGPIYTTKYPALATIQTDEPPKPKYNEVTGNIFVGSGKWCTVTDPKQYFGSRIGPEDNIIGVDPGFVDAARGDYRLSDTSPALKSGFKRIPFERIGLYQDEYRSGFAD